MTAQHYNENLRAALWLAADANQALQKQDTWLANHRLKELEEELTRIIRETDHGHRSAQRSDD